MSKDELNVMIFALRYTTGRHTYAPMVVCDYIIKQIPRMDAIQQEMTLYEVLKIIGHNAIDYQYKDYVKLRDALQEAIEHASG